jgi:hypothetical protein
LQHVPLDVDLSLAKKLIAANPDLGAEIEVLATELRLRWQGRGTLLRFHRPWWYGRSDRARRLHRPGKVTLHRIIKRRSALSACLCFATDN